MEQIEKNQIILYFCKKRSYEYSSRENRTCENDT